jgi:hypothetical protein
MMSSFNLFIEITAKDSNLCETAFRERLAPCIAYLDALKGVFDKESCSTFFYPPGPDGKTTRWSARCAVMIFVGKERGEYLLELYRAIARLIVFELPDFDIQADAGNFSFS